MSRVKRLYKIIQTLRRYRLDEFIDSDSLPALPRALLRIFSYLPRPSGDLSRGVRLRKALEELGPVFIKFGQLLSTRRDLLPPDIADELARLQDDVPPFAPALSVAIIEKALGSPVGELFASFEATPMASASVAQIHAATLHSGESVVAKVVRPDIEPIIRQDVALMLTLARLVEKYLPDGKRLRPVEVVGEYELTILDELDLAREAANASQLRRNFADSKLIYVPKVYWDYSCRDVFVMERISGIPVTDMERLRSSGTDLKLLAERGVEIFFTQVFRDSFFHADMHPGNIFVDISDPADPTYIAIDCAIVGSLSDSDQYYLARNLLGVFQRDYREVARLHVECGWVPPHTRVQDFEAAMRAVCEPVFDRPISEISFGQLLIYLFQTARRFEMEVQPSLILLQKTLLNIEGLGRELYPQLNLWDTAQPFLEEWVRERYSAQSMMKRLQQQAPSLLEQLPHLPDAIFAKLQHKEVQPNPPVPTQQQGGNSAVNKWRLATTALLVAAALMALPQAGHQLAETPLSIGLLSLAALSLFWPGNWRA